MNSKRGSITVDFLLAFVLVMGFSMILFALSLTLTVAEITQYLTFASARNYMAAHLTPGDQEFQAQTKYSTLKTNPFFKALFQNDWFEISPVPDIGDISARIRDYSPQSGGTNYFWGVGTRFTAKVLEFGVGPFGTTNAAGDGQGSFFTTYVGSYLGRESSTSECLTFVSQRWSALRGLPAINGATAYSQAPNSNAYRIYDDNGC